MAALEVTLDQLELDLDNPRFDGLSNQKEALEKIVVSQGAKIVNLAEDIVNEGLSPAHRMLVRPTRKGGLYTVLDGNRRLAALRVLANPASLGAMKGVGDVTAQKLRKLADEFDVGLIEPIDVFACADDDEARHWIEAIHTGENEGRGVVGWDGIATARYRGKNASLKVLDFIKAAGKLTGAEISALERFPITNLDRLLATPDVRAKLGLAMESGEILSDLPQGELLRPLKRIVNDLASKKVRVSDIKRAEDRVRYVNSLGHDLPDLGKRTGVIEPLDRISAHVQATNQSKASASAKSKSLIERKALIPPQAQCPLHIDNEKLQRICKELRKLPIDQYPVSIAAMFRVFLELSLDHYGVENKVPSYNVDLTLKKKLEMVADSLVGNGLNKRDLQAFKSLAHSQAKALSVDRLHGIVHSRFALPTADELRVGWAEVQVAFVEIWKP